ncbi:MAG: hypothetical protein HYY13_11550 [Nitrospirae bacterium]|nr:hypothetical protein [Nitrospirota bacterium]
MEGLRGLLRTESLRVAGRMRNARLREVFQAEGIAPVLVDVGAAGGVPDVWSDLAPISVYVGFDPDGGVGEGAGPFKRTILVQALAVCGEDQSSVPFFVTRSPQCSSTLRPDHASLQHYLFAPLFEVEREVRLKGRGLSEALREHGLDRVDWFKSDSQGIDLRLFNSLSDEVRTRVLAVELEPGLADAYQGEDLFVDAHRELLQQGFWLSSLRVGGAVRTNPEVLREPALEKEGLRAQDLMVYTRESPFFCGPRYLRGLEGAHAAMMERPDYVKLWAFALLDDQVGFALEVWRAYEARFGQDPLSKRMREEPLERLRLARRGRGVVLAKALIPAWAKRSLARLFFRAGGA